MLIAVSGEVREGRQAKRAQALEQRLGSSVIR
jgi:hypothetical protein